MILDIRDFGAHPGATPEANTRAIQAAIDMAKPGDTIGLPFHVETTRPLYLGADAIGLIGIDPGPKPPQEPRT